jgi:hypothetical protein
MLYIDIHTSQPIQNYERHKTLLMLVLTSINQSWWRSNIYNPLFQGFMIYGIHTILLTNCLFLRSIIAWLILIEWLLLISIMIDWLTLRPTLAVSYVSHNSVLVGLCVYLYITFLIWLFAILCMYTIMNFDRKFLKKETTYFVKLDHI